MYFKSPPGSNLLVIVAGHPREVCSIVNTWLYANAMFRSDAQSQSPIIFPPGINQGQRTLGLLGHPREGCGALLGSHHES